MYDRDTQLMHQKIPTDRKHAVPSKIFQKFPIISPLEGLCFLFRNKQKQDNSANPPLPALSYVYSGDGTERDERCRGMVVQMIIRNSKHTYGGSASGLYQITGNTC